jgi:hypothetical protein
MFSAIPILIALTSTNVSTTRAQHDPAASVADD